MAIEARDRINREAGSRRAMAHAIIQPGAPGWLDAIDRDIALRPDAFKGYTIGDNTHKDLAKPWRLDDEALVYSFYENRTDVVKGKSVSVRVDLGGRRSIKQKTKRT